MSTPAPPRPDRFYTPDHEWAKPDSSEVIVGISAFAVEQLGDITLVDLTVAPGDVIAPHQTFGTVESVKTLSDLFSPLGGRVTRINVELLEHPEWVNEDCWEKAWMIAINPESTPFPPENLLDSDAYRTLLAEAEH